MKLLSIETSCDETAVAVLEASGDMNKLAFTVLGNALYSQAQKHAVYGGVFPSLAKREHAVNLVPLLDLALKDAHLGSLEERRLTREDQAFLAGLLVREPELLQAIVRYAETHGKPVVDAIAVTTGPGLEPALWVGINFARALSYLWNLPIIPVNHLEGHVIASAVTSSDAGRESYTVQELAFPILGLILSGGHTEFVYAHAWGEYEVLGATRDDSIGEAFDKVARLVGIPYPGGAGLSALAEKGRQAPSLITTPHHRETAPLPRPMIASDDLDFSFSGLKTAVLYRVRDAGTLSDKDQEQLAAAFEEAVVDVLLAKTERALSQHTAHTFLIGGGVSANTYIRKRMQALFDRRGDVTLRLPARGLSTDNAIMIGMAGYVAHLRGVQTYTGTDDLVAMGTMRMGEDRPHVRNNPH